MHYKHKQVRHATGEGTGGHTYITNSYDNNASNFIKAFYQDQALTYCHGVISLSLRWHPNESITIEKVTNSWSWLNFENFKRHMVWTPS